MQVLVADDDPTSRKMLSVVLEKFGYEVHEAANGTEALQCLESDVAPPLAVLDWLMPEMDGIEVLRRIRAADRTRQPYILMVTSQTRKQDMITGLHAGADDYIGKPCDPAELRARVGVGCRIIEYQDLLRKRNEELQVAFREIRNLRGMIPICASCKSIRDDAGYWKQVDVYIREHSDLEFSHGICPECMKKLYPDMVDDDLQS